MKAHEFTVDQFSAFPSHETLLPAGEDARLPGVYQAVFGAQVLCLRPSQLLGGLATQVLDRYETEHGADAQGVEFLKAVETTGGWRLEDVEVPAALADHRLNEQPKASGGGLKRPSDCGAGSAEANGSCAGQPEIECKSPYEFIAYGVCPAESDPEEGGPAKGDPAESAKTAEHLWSLIVPKLADLQEHRHLRFEATALEIERTVFAEKGEEQSKGKLLMLIFTAKPEGTESKDQLRSARSSSIGKKPKIVHA